LAGYIKSFFLQEGEEFRIVNAIQFINYIGSAITIHNQDVNIRILITAGRLIFDRLDNLRFRKSGYEILAEVKKNLPN